MSIKKTLDITPSPRLLQVLGDIPLRPWQCLAELIDNSLDELLKQPDRSSDDPLRVEIDVLDEGPRGVYLQVKDNGSGMGSEELERSLRAGHSGKNRYGSLGLFGMGFNIATARLGNSTTVLTTQRGSDELLEATIDFAEIQQSESFSVPLQRHPVDSEESGTTVKVLLKRDMAKEFTRAKSLLTLGSQLGDVYSFLLRESVPGLNREGMSAKIPAEISIAGTPINPKLPCVWSDERSVTSYGQEVHAIQYIDRKLTPATACLSCGYWDRKNGPENCEECGSANLELRERHIWGWIGIQRYIDSSSYGVDFIRYGRKILKQDQSIFKYTDPDTLQTDQEYPIEMPANQGRIVGEIHLDHVPVTYQKNDFDRQSRDWQLAVEVIRGQGPLKPRGSEFVNNSPLALLYSAYRRNDPGLRYLTPGDGKRALHSKAREWGNQFHKGVARLRDDTEWYDAAVRHQAIKDGTPPEEEQDGDEDATDDAFDELIGDGASGDAPKKSDDPPPETTPKQDQLDVARKHGHPRHDLSGKFRLGRGLGPWDIEVVATREQLQDDDGEPVPVLTGKVSASRIEIFVATRHQIFKEYGRDIRDVALMQAAVLIKNLRKSKLSVASIFGALVLQVDDLKVTPSAILGRIERTLDRTRTLMLPVVEEDPDHFWRVLDASQKQKVEELAAVDRPNEGLEEIVDSGEFILFTSAEALAELITERAQKLFDGVVFKPAYQPRGDAAQDRIVGGVVRPLLSVAAFQQDDLLRQKHDMHLVQISLDILEDQLNSHDLLS